MHSKKQPLASLKEGDAVNDIFVVKIKKGISQYTKGYSFSLILSDGSGASVDYKYWGGENEVEVRRLYDSIVQDAVVLITGRAGSYNGRIQITTNPPMQSVRPLKEGEYSAADFIQPERRPIPGMLAELKGYVDGVQEADMRKLLVHFFGEGSPVAARFSTHPGAIEIHHNWRGGLLQHTLEVAKYCDLTKSLFAGADRDLLITGALLHDLGKLEEMEVTTRIKGTRQGQLHHHIPMGFAMVSKAMDSLATPALLRDKILHIIISHHGHTEYSSPKEPMFPEAIAVYYADELSSKMAEVLESRARDRENTEDDFMYNKLHGRNMFLK